MKTRVCLIYFVNDCGVSWLKNLQKYSKSLNNEKREELGWKSALVGRYTSVENPTNCSNMESRLKRIGNVSLGHASIYRVRSLVIMNEKH